MEGEKTMAKKRELEDKIAKLKSKVKDLRSQLGEKIGRAHV